MEGEEERQTDRERVRERARQKEKEKEREKVNESRTALALASLAVERMGCFKGCGLIHVIFLSPLFSVLFQSMPSGAEAPSEPSRV